MNILVQSHDSDICTFRPETTWDKNGRDFYPQEDIAALAFAPVLCVHISRAGRSVKEKFASRYFDTVGFGVLLYDENLLHSGTVTGYAQSSCIDHTSFLPVPTYERTVLGLPERRFILCRGDRKIFDYGGEGISIIEHAIACATAHSYIRTGDFLCIELAPISHLCRREDAEVRLSASFNGTTLFDFNIIM